MENEIKLFDQFINLDSNISSTENDVNIHIGKAWTIINRLLISKKCVLCDKKTGILQAVAVSVLLCGCTTWTLMKCLEKI